LTALSGYKFAILREGEVALYRGSGAGLTPILVVAPLAEQPTLESLRRLEHEYTLRTDLDRDWAAQPLAITRHDNRPTLVLADPGGEPLDRLLGQPLDISQFLRIAISLVAVLRRVHERNLIHKDIKPGNVLVDWTSGRAWLTGFGIATRAPRERQVPAPPEVIAGTLAYMAPEQTGRMNRSIDSRSDLYAIGVTFYEMLTGALPFTATDPMAWVHCHIARQPLSPTQLGVAVPTQISAIVMKLLAKTAEDRYQTAAGVEHELRRCLAEWETRGRIDEFPLGEHDLPDRLLIPEKLYGRADEVSALLGSFDRVVTSGMPELVLVSGYSGIGKSSVVNELHKVLVPPRGLFASGKFDQYKRDIPYATLAQACQGLVRQILSKSEAELHNWRDALREALGPNGLLMVDLIPELELVIEEQPPVPDLLPQDAQRRFQLVFRRFIGVFARLEHPLALFLDDLQWLDAATLDLLEDLLTQRDIRHLLLIGAYRDNEVTSAHPLMRKLHAIRRAGVSVQDIVLAPLTYDDLGQLIADSLRCAPERASLLAQLVHEKTGGNPFFAIQFLYALAEEGLLTFDHGDARWSWDLNRIDAKRYTDNVVDLMVDKLNRLPAQTQKMLRQLACVGHSAEFALLGTVSQTSLEEVHANLWEALRSGLVLRSESSYWFQHDRVQEAAYSLIPEELRAEAHLRIGRLLAAHTPPEKREEIIFEIVNQFSRSTALITSLDEREQVAQLSLIAGKRAKTVAAYSSALTHFAAGRALLGDDCWTQQHSLTFELELHRAECEFLTGDLAAAEDRLSMLSCRAVTTIERANVACLQVDLYTALDQASRAIAVGLDYLRHLGIDWSPHPTDDEARREYERIWSQLGSLEIEGLIDLPLMSDAASLATLDVLTKLGPPAYFTDANLRSLVICRAVNLSLEGGNCDGSSYAYTVLGFLAGPCFGDYQAGLRFGRLGYDLVEQRGLKRFQARTYLNFGYLLMFWTRHVREGRDLLRRAFETANQIGDLTFAAYYYTHLNTYLLAAGDPLDEVQDQVERGLAFARNMRFGFAIHSIAGQLGLVRTLRGSTPKFGSFDDERFDELQLERRFSSNPDLALAESWYWIRKLQARFFAGDYGDALDAASKAQPLLWTSPSMFEMAEYHFYGALSQAASCGSVAAGERRQHIKALVEHHRQLEVWARVCPENFENPAALVGAELARLEGRDLDAEHLYEQAIRSARASGFIHNEALACEVAACFYAARGFEDIAEMYLLKAHHGYLRWGADGKVRQLEVLHPRMVAAEMGALTTGSSGRQLDVAAVVKASQTLSSEMLLPHVIERLMTIALQNAGADRGLLILPHQNDYRIEAEARTTGEGIVLQHSAVTGPSAPETVIRYVMRTQKSVILDDATKPGTFSEDGYLRRRQPRSVLCLPLVRQGVLGGLLYLENTMTSHVFTPDRTALLELLASQAAISLENTRLYADLQEREAKVRRLVDSNIIGIIIWDSQGRIIEANKAFLNMVGYDREDLVSGRLRRTELTPAEWRDADERAIAEVQATGSVQPREKEYFRKDGSRVPVLIGAAAFGDRRDEGVAFVLDLTERKRTEGALREAQTALAHVNRVTTMGQLTASIAHEVNQPIASAVANAQAGLLWLEASPPDLEEVRQALESIVKDGNRAADVIGRIRALIKKVPPRDDPLDVNEMVLEVVALAKSELLRNGVSLETRLEQGLPLRRGDRVRLQQAVLNLIINAIEAMSGVSEGPRELLISTEMEPSGGVLITVQDSGPGLDAANLDRLFEAFYTTKPRGMGMGLSICRLIIETHGGRLWATANEPRGATFQFNLPEKAETAS
jgi:PAS domain S-box-containing protein